MKDSPVSVNTIARRENLLPWLWQEAIEGDAGVALWRLPHQKLRHLILSERQQKLREVSLEELPGGFLFSPFDRNAEKIFLEASFKFSFDPELTEPETPLELSSRQWLKQKTDSFHEVKATSFHSGKSVATPPSADASAYEQLVHHAVDEIRRGSMEKVVGTRVKRIELPSSFDVILAFDKLCREYPDAFVSLVSLPGVGTWLGATPEVLVTIRDNRYFLTSALAGTQPYEKGTDPRNVAWREKEIEEQALVCRYIINCFKKIRLREYEEHGPRTVLAGNVLHLNTEYRVDMEAVNFPQLGSVMLELLHPTSAVCGMPYETAIDFIGRHEGFDREFYTGYLGPVDPKQNTHLFVNLRCMQLLGDHALIYAGAGLTADSEPSREWAETEIKMNTLLNVLRP